MEKRAVKSVEEDVLKRAAGIDSPANYYLGLRMEPGFELPGNILCFYHDFPSEAPQQHYRCCLVIAFDQFEYVMDQKKVFAERGSAIFHAPFCSHSIPRQSHSCRRLQITFELNGKPGYLPENGVYPMTHKAWKLADEVLKKFKSKSPVECAVYLYKLCSELQGKMADPPPSPAGEILPSVRFFINFNYHWRENIKSIAAKLGMSESNLRLRFRNENNMSLGEYLKKQKLELAQYRLEYTSEPLKDIALLCGYDSVYSFSRFFKNAAGISPLRYRQMKKRCRSGQASGTN